MTLKKLLEEATEGEWAVLVCQGDTFITLQEHAGRSIGGSVDPDREAAQFAKTIARIHKSKYEKYHRSRVMLEEGNANARLIVHLHNHAAAFAELVEAAREMLAESEYFTRERCSNVAQEYGTGTDAERRLRAALRGVEGRDHVDQREG